MKKNLVVRAGALLVMFCALPASAGVIYRWQDVTPNPNTGPFEGYIEFSDAAWRPGGHLILDGSFDGTPASLRPTQDIERFSWTNPSGLGLGIFQGIGMALAPCSALDTALQDYCEPEDTFLTSGHTGVRFNFDVTFGALLAGGLSVDTDQAFVRMESASAPLWTIGGTASEVGGACFSLLPTGCLGSTGIWVLDLSTLPTSVPEPSTIGLMLLGLSALLVARLRGRRAGSLVARVSIAGALLISAMPASAGVIYRWQDVTPNPNTGPFEGLIEFSYDAWSANGHLSTSTTGAGGEFVPIQGVERFLWANPGAAGIRHTIELALGRCNSWELTGLCESDDIVLLPNSDAMFVHFDLDFGALLQGDFSVGLGHSNVGMSSSGPLWTIDALATDWDGVCRLPQDGLCTGSTGLWVLDLSSLPPVRVPEPSSALLTLLAIVGISFSRARKRA